MPTDKARGRGRYLKRQPRVLVLVREGTGTNKPGGAQRTTLAPALAVPLPERVPGELGLMDLLGMGSLDLPVMEVREGVEARTAALLVVQMGTTRLRVRVWVRMGDSSRRRRRTRIV